METSRITRLVASASSSSFASRTAGFGLIALAILSVLLMLKHPTTGAHDFTEFVARAGHGVPGNTCVHGMLVTILLLMATCFLWLREALGAHRPLVRAGLIAMTVGVAGAVTAGLVNGFIVPNTASHFLDASPAELEPLRPVLTLARETAATCARVGMVGLSLAAAAWSIALLLMPGWRRAAGVVGLCAGLLPLAIHAGEHLHMNVPGYSLFVCAHALWAVVAGVVLVRHRARP